MLEVGDGLFQAIVKRDPGLPVKQCFGLGQIWLALPRIVLRQRLVDQLRFGIGDADDFLGQFQDREFRVVAEIDRAGTVVIRQHQACDAFDQIVDIAE